MFPKKFTLFSADYVSGGVKPGGDHKDDHDMVHLM